ncbi:Protein of unknown function [Pyronema omphalodes CBS 100304]|uniref:Uncharacterized protein n=1 Tax=Pyronema omphalodes (strain CBS 100304) TaxID=1076935 RepID=U4LB75_PYROM|nr:Protein of unknown function [Pyronema omphalodes CBS 100304]
MGDPARVIEQGRREGHSLLIFFVLFWYFVL